MYETAAIPNRLLTALLIALFCHALILGLLTWPQKPHSATAPARLNVRIAAPDLPAPASSTQSYPSTTQAPVITSREGESVQFHLPEQLPNRVPSFRPPSSDTTWIGTLFAPSTPALEQNTVEHNQITQLSTEALPQMSPYQRLLLETLARNQYHDAQYAFSRLQQERQVRLRLRLLANGALVRADILQSSGDPALDQAAQRSAYAASPFPAPPQEDAAISYTYTIDIRYQPRSPGRP